MRILNRVSSSIPLGPLNSSSQRRWTRKPSSPRLPRTLDRTLDEVSRHHRRLNTILSICGLISSSPDQCLSISRLFRSAPLVGLNTYALPVLPFVRKYPHIFQVFTHPLYQTTSFNLTSTFLELLKLEQHLLSTQQNEKLNVLAIKKILLMSVKACVHVNSITLIRSELGLPENFRESIIMKYDQEFRLGDSGKIELVDGGEGSRHLRVAVVENWRRKELEDKWLGEFEVNYAFPVSFPDRFKEEPGFKQRLINWQRLTYVKPYEREEDVHLRNDSPVERYEKRAVGIIHELLWLTVEKRMPVERLSHFREDLGMMVNIRQVLLKHPGIFTVSHKGKIPMLFLREAYDYKGCLIEPNPIYDVRRKMWDLVKLKARNPRDLLPKKEPKEEPEEETE